MMFKFNNLKRLLFNRRLLAFAFSVLSFGSIAAYGKVVNFTNVQESNNGGGRVIRLRLGVGVNNPRYENVHNRMKEIRELNIEELVQIFENEFVPIIRRDADTINNVGAIDNFNLFLLEWIDDERAMQNRSYFINLLWAGGIFVFLNEGFEGIENMQEDFRNWGHTDISVNDVCNYFMQKIERH